MVEKLAIIQEVSDHSWPKSAMLSCHVMSSLKWLWIPVIVARALLLKLQSTKPWQIGIFACGKQLQSSPILGHLPNSFDLPHTGDFKVGQFDGLLNPGVGKTDSCCWPLNELVPGSLHSHSNLMFFCFVLFCFFFLFSFFFVCVWGPTLSPVLRSSSAAMLYQQRLLWNRKHTKNSSFR